MANNSANETTFDLGGQSGGQIEWSSLVGNILMSCVLTSCTIDKVSLYIITTIVYGGLNLARFLFMGRKLPSSTIIFIGLGLKGIKLKGWKIINFAMFCVSLLGNVLEYFRKFPKWMGLPGRSWMALGVLSMDVLLVSTYLAYLSRIITNKTHELIGRVAIRLTGLALISTALYMLGYAACIPLIAYTFYTAGKERLNPRFLGQIHNDRESEIL